MSDERLREIEERATYEGNYEFMLHGRQDIAELVKEVKRQRASIAPLVVSLGNLLAEGERLAKELSEIGKPEGESHE
jgi:hypothetical protein